MTSPARGARLCLRCLQAPTWAAVNLCLVLVIATALVVVPLAFLLPLKEGPGRTQATPGEGLPEAPRSALGGDVLLLGSVLVLILLSTALLGLLNWWVALISRLRFCPFLLFSFHEGTF